MRYSCPLGLLSLSTIQPNSQLSEWKGEMAELSVTFSLPLTESPCYKNGMCMYLRRNYDGTFPLSSQMERGIGRSDSTSELFHLTHSNNFRGL